MKHRVLLMLKDEQKEIKLSRKSNHGWRKPKNRTPRNKIYRSQEGIISRRQPHIYINDWVPESHLGQIRELKQLNANAMENVFPKRKFTLSS